MQMKTTNPATSLTPRQLQLLEIIADFQTSRGYSPTIAELSEQLRISRSTAFEHIAELRKKGFIQTSPGKARSLKLTFQAQELLSRLGDHNHNCDCDSSQPAALPLAGRVAAGLPIEVVEDCCELSLQSCFGTGDDVFSLEVSGDSMIDEDIRDGDYVICRRSAAANDGQLVVAIVDNDSATLKRFYREKDRVRLQPANDNYQPIYSDNCRIKAVVVGLVRKY